MLFSSCFESSCCLARLCTPILSFARMPLPPSTYVALISPASSFSRYLMPSSPPSNAPRHCIYPTRPYLTPHVPRTHIFDAKAKLHRTRLQEWKSMTQVLLLSHPKGSLIQVRPRLAWKSRGEHNESEVVFITESKKEARGLQRGEKGKDEAETD